jgi:hypothetical protein
VSPRNVVVWIRKLTLRLSIEEVTLPCTSIKLNLISVAKCRHYGMFRAGGCTFGNTKCDVYVIGSSALKREE